MGNGNNDDNPFLIGDEDTDEEEFYENLPPALAEFLETHPEAAQQMGGSSHSFQPLGGGEEYEMQQLSYNQGVNSDALAHSPDNLEEQVRNQMLMEREAETAQPSFVAPVDYDNMSEEEIIAEQMAEVQRIVENNEKEHVVRGAYIRCNCGSHVRRLNLKTGHNTFEDGRPLINCIDSLPGDNYNISYFGVCSAAYNTSAEDIVVQEDKVRDAYGNEIGPAPDHNIKGKRCTLKIATNWMCSHEGLKVAGENAVTLNSYLVCDCGGIIGVINSGQSMEDNVVDLDSK